MTIALLVALLASFVLGAAFTVISAWPRRSPLASAGGLAKPQVTWPALLDVEARLGIVQQLAAKPDAARLELLRKAADQEDDPRIQSAVQLALRPVIGEPQ